MRRLSSLMTLILVASVLLIGGVSAAWIYATGNATGDSTDANIGMGDWEFNTVNFINEAMQFYSLDIPEAGISNGVLYANAGFTQAQIDAYLNTFLQGENAAGYDEAVEALNAKNAKHALLIQIAKIKAGLITQQSDSSVDYSKSNLTFEYWVNAGSTRVDSIPAGTKGEVNLFPKFNLYYNALYVDPAGNVVAWDVFTKGKGSNVIAKAAAATDAINEYLEREGLADDMSFDYWQVQYTDGTSPVPFIVFDTADNRLEFANANSDLNNVTSTGVSINDTAPDKAYKFNVDKNITIYPIFKYDNINLVPVDEDNDGKTDYYDVAGFGSKGGQDLIEIPPIGSNGKEVETISNKAFNSYPDLHSVRIPITVTKIGDNAFPGDNSWFGANRETITLYYEGTKDQWKTLTDSSPNWDVGVGADSRVFFLDENGKVDRKEGYYQMISSWGRFSWEYHEYVGDELVAEYTENCTCSSCSKKPDTDKISGEPRADKKYWD